MSKTKLTKWPHLVIRASAGTGKTFQLSNRYLQLLAAGVPGEQILASTFTRKAAGEILDRVLYRLAKAATSEAERQQLGKFIAGGKLSHDECLDLLEQATRNLHRLRVGTLDSFFMAIAGSFCLELGLPSGWTISDDVTDQQLRVKAIEATLAQDSTQDLVALVHLLTKAETTRSISRLVQDTVNDVYSMFLDTSAEAWQQLPHLKGLEEAEFHDLLQQIEDFPLAGELDKKRKECLDRIVAGDWEKVVSSGLACKIIAGETKFNRKEIPAELIALFERLLEHGKAALINPIVWHTQGTHRLLEKFDREYRRLKQQHRVLRFDDVTRIIANSSALESGEKLGFRLDGGVKHLLLDEFQDTSLSQWQVLRPFAREVTLAKAGTSFFCVGDTKQAIYGWRGGVAQIFDAIEGELQSLENQNLVESFRSSPAVIDTVNQLFTNLTLHGNLERHEAVVRRWQSEFPLHTTARKELPGYSCVRVMPEPEEDEDATDCQDKYVARYVQQLLEQSPGKEIGVLVRTNDTVRRLIFALREIGIPASEEGGNPLIDSAAVGLILSLLKVADHPGDTVARYHLATSALGIALGYTSFKEDASAARLASALREELLHAGFGPAVLRWAKLLAPHCNQRELSRLDQLVELAYRFQPQGSLRADRFISLVEQQKVSDPSAAPVRVMNVHQSKGLQFDIVVLPELSTPLHGRAGSYVVGRKSPIEPVDTVLGYAARELWPLFPAQFRQLFEHANDQHLVEMLCMLYVATTRAVHAMHMLLAPKEAKGATPGKTLAGLIRAALCQGQVLSPGELAYEHGDAQWYQHLPPTAPKTSVAPAPFTIALKNAAQGRKRGWQGVSPSQLEGGASLKISEVFRPARSAGQDFGTLIHAWLSQVTWLEEGLPQPDVLSRLASEVGWQSDITAQAKQWTTWLEQPALQRLLSRQQVAADSPWPADRFEVENERRFALRQDGQLMTGSIDRLVIYQRAGEVVGADIIDYKTDSLPAGDATALAEKVEFYRPQIEAYAAAVQRMYCLTSAQCRCRLVFLGTGEVITLEGSPPHEVSARRGSAHRQSVQRPLF